MSDSKCFSETLSMEGYRGLLVEAHLSEFYPYIEEPVKVLVQGTGDPETGKRMWVEEPWALDLCPGVTERVVFDRVRPQVRLVTEGLALGNERFLEIRVKRLP